MGEPINFEQFFLRREVQFPLDRGDDDFQSFVDKRLQDYFALVRDIEPLDILTQQIKAEAAKIQGLCDLLKAAIAEYMKGLPHQAFAKLEKAISGVRAELQRLIKPVDHLSKNELYRQGLGDQREMFVERYDADGLAVCSFWCGVSRDQDTFSELCLEKIPP